MYVFADDIDVSWMPYAVEKTEVPETPKVAEIIKRRMSGRSTAGDHGTVTGSMFSVVLTLMETTQSKCVE